MQPGATYRLIVRRGPQPNQQYDLTRDTITIGRDITNDIVINDPEVSRHHSRLVRTATGYAIEDLRSTNGTFVNRQRITSPTQLSHGDLIGLGETVTLVFESSMGANVGATLPGSGSSAPPSAPQPPAAPAGAAPGGASYQPAPPPAPGPVAREEESEGPDVNRLIVIGCGALTLIFCCLLVGGAIAVDQLNLYCDLPFASQLFGANCPPIP
ncbi:MAG: FHA domain-containing protein [Chloroflexi bacterium]|nr:FHA domain-containing protein [Chloroflexota bacterium]